MPERTETGYEVFPEAKDLLFTVTKPAEKGKTQKGKYFYVFRFKTVLNDRTKNYSEAMMTWMAGDLLRVLGCKEVSKGIFEWEKDEIVGRQVVADIVHEPDFRDPDKPTAKMRNLRPVDDLTAQPQAAATEPPAELPAGSSLDEGEIPF
jgi:hypothetical protein